MRLLLDTHIYLWYITDSPRLSRGFRDAIRNLDNSVMLSVAAVWECVIKHALGKLTLPEPPAVYLPRQREAHQIASLPIEEGGMASLAALPPHHRDPFDRIMVAQVIFHELTLVTADPVIAQYGVRYLPHT